MLILTSWVMFVVVELQWLSFGSLPSKEIGNDATWHHSAVRPAVQEVLKGTFGRKTESWLGARWARSAKETSSFAARMEHLSERGSARRAREP